MSNATSFYIVGLTGGIASGKSTVAEMFEELGVPVIDADVIARQIVEPGEPALREIAEAFGDEVVREDGALDREALGARVFEDEGARDRLEQITHPRIAQKMRERADELREEGHRWVLYDAALIVENNMHRWLDALVVVAADPAVQEARIVERDDLTPEEARKRIDAQMPLEAKVEVADYVIDNNGSLERTRRQVEDVFERIENRIRSGAKLRPSDDSNG